MSQMSNNVENVTLDSEKHCHEEMESKLFGMNQLFIC